MQTIGERGPLHGELGRFYNAIENPRKTRGELPILRDTELRSYLEDVRERALEVLSEVDIGPDAKDPLLREGFVYEMLLAHEQQHNETMLQLLQMVEDYSPVDPELGALCAFGADSETIWMAGGEYEIGAPAQGFAYDNERPRHTVELGAYRIARTPVSNATWLSFAEGGGYQRREWWSDEGWSWKQCYDITHPLGWSDGPPAEVDAPVQHVSWFEVDAFARSHGARLPTEAEWERAATSTQEDGNAALDGLGAVWEWTASEFIGYPGFRAHPYPEYSEVFFDKGYRVLRGGSWAADPVVATPTFRNWDLPQRRQIFSGVRLAREM